MINRSEEFVKGHIQTQNVERMWRDLKEWCARPGIKVQFLRQYLARYLFIKAHEKEDRLCAFIKQCAQLYPFKMNKVKNQYFFILKYTFLPFFGGRQIRSFIFNENEEKILKKKLSPSKKWQK